MALVLTVIVAGLADGKSDSRQVLDASKVLAQIGSGEPVNYTNVIIEGDLTSKNFPTEQVNRNNSQFESGPAKKVAKSSIKILDSEIRGQVDLSNVIFIENVDFSGTNFTANTSFLSCQFRGNARFSWSRFNGNACFSWCQFSSDANFVGAEFNGDAYFEGANFSSYANFGKVNFSSCANFAGANFSGKDFSGRCTNFGEVNFIGNANFGGSNFGLTNLSGFADFCAANFSSVAYFGGGVNFRNDALFHWVDFSGDANFGGANFSGDADFDMSDFSRVAYFGGGVNFRNDALFHWVDFSGDADFGGANFSGDTNFLGAKFNSDVNFERANFSGDAELNETQFHKDADFSGSQFNKNSNFVEAQFDGDANFEEAEFNEGVTFEEAKFCGYALFEGANFSNTSTFCLNRTQCVKKIRLKWKAIEGDDKLPIVWWDDKDSKLVFDEEAYLTLYKNYRDLGWFDDANKCYYEYMKHRSCESFTSGCINTVLHVSYGYGTKPEYSLYWSVALMAIFGVIWSRTGIRGSIFETDSTKRGSGLRNRIAKFANRKGIAKVADPYLFSAKIFLSGTKLFVDPPKYRKPPGWRGSAVKILFVGERTLGMMLFFLFIFAVSASMLIKII